MIVKEDKGYETNSFYPNSDWYNNGNYVVDETTESGQLLAEKIKKHCPYFDFVLDSKGNLINITPTERPPEPILGPTEIDLLGQQLVEKELQILELQQENQILGQQLVDIDLRLLIGGL